MEELLNQLIGQAKGLEAGSEELKTQIDAITKLSKAMLDETKEENQKQQAIYESEEKEIHYKDEMELKKRELEKQELHYNEEKALKERELDKQERHYNEEKELKEKDAEEQKKARRLEFIFRGAELLGGVAFGIWVNRTKINMFHEAAVLDERGIRSDKADKWTKELDKGLKKF